MGGLVLDPTSPYKVLVGGLGVARHLAGEEVEHARQWMVTFSQLSFLMFSCLCACRMLLALSRATEKHSAVQVIDSSVRERKRSMLICRTTFVRKAIQAVRLTS